MVLVPFIARPSGKARQSRFGWERQRRHLGDRSRSFWQGPGQDHERPVGPLCRDLRNAEPTIGILPNPVTWCLASSRDRRVKLAIGEKLPSTSIRRWPMNFVVCSFEFKMEPSSRSKSTCQLSPSAVARRWSCRPTVGEFFNGLLVAKVVDYWLGKSSKHMAARG